MKPKTMKRMVYAVSLFLLILSGFAQMPVFKRYYIADLPGLGWLARFYVTHAVHYGAAAVFTGYAARIFCDVLITGKKQRLPLKQAAKGVIFLGLIATGGLMVIKNFTGTPFSHNVIIGLNLLHLVLCCGLVLMLTGEAAAAIRSAFQRP